MKVKLILFISLLLIAGCADVLDKKDLSAISEAEVWNNATYATNYINKLCRDILPGWDNDISNNSDDAYFSGNNILYGQLTNDGVDYWPYDQIRNVNLFLSSVGTGAIDAETQSILTGQALVLRAWLYFRLVRFYGGVPLVLEPQALQDDLYVTRSRTSECVDRITADLDDALASDMPWTWSGDDAGRISKAAALALKARVLLYYASPQFNRPGTRNEQRWTNACNVNRQAVEQLSANGHGLHGSFSDVWFDEMNAEAVFVKRYQYPGLDNSWSSGSRPLEVGMDVSGRNQPTVEMVDAFPMRDGIPTSESPDFDPVLYWKNRDPRFAATIAYNSCIWPLIGRAGTRQWTYRGYASEQNNGTRTGYYCRKAVDVTYTAFDALHSSTDWIEIRYAEVLLNFAECAAETGHDDEAIAVLKQIRARAGIEPGAAGMYGLKPGLTGAGLIQAIMLERRLEFAFEGMRYWDLRRRRMFESELNGTRRHGRFANLVPGLTPTDFDNIRLTFPDRDYETEYSEYFIDEVILADTQFDINFPENYYFYGIPNSHLQTNSRLQQTLGWPDNGSGLFDPYD
jgi:hypothetical protein